MSTCGGYQTFLADARAFLADLEANNSRDWFRDHKSRYDRQVKRPADRLLSDMADWLGARFQLPIRAKLFRPQRDTRFSDDKTPFHTHVHMMWSLPDGRAWFLGIAQNYAAVGAGVMGFDARRVEAWREAVAGAPGEALETLVSEAGWTLGEPGLDTVPAPYDPDHPRADLLRRMDLIAWQNDLDEAFRADPLAAAQRATDSFDPLLAWLDRHVLACIGA